MTPITAFELAGSLLILAAFGAAQARRLDTHSVAYLVLNVLGAGTLAVVALLHRSWGFLLLEGVWTVVSAISLARISLPGVARPRREPGRGDGQ